MAVSHGHMFAIKRRAARTRDINDKRPLASIFGLNSPDEPIPLDRVAVLLELSASPVPRDRRAPILREVIGCRHACPRAHLQGPFGLGWLVTTGMSNRSGPGFSRRGRLAYRVVRAARRCRRRSCHLRRAGRLRARTGAASPPGRAFRAASAGARNGFATPRPERPALREPVPGAPAP
jgi:hypothetical protein